MKYVSTTSSSIEVSFEDAVVGGYAADGGLYVPEIIPKISREEFRSWAGLSYGELCFRVFDKFVSSDEIPRPELRRLMLQAFDESRFGKVHKVAVPVVSLSKTRKVLELFHGPTLSFKDLGQGVLLGLLDFFVARQNKKLQEQGLSSVKRNVVVATSGDTGPAACHAAIPLHDTMNMWCLYPKGFITGEQERQMTTIDCAHVHAISVENSNSDDLDVITTELFSDAAFNKVANLSSVNSINIARVVAQSVHFLAAYLQVCPGVDEELHFSVPTGAGGDLFGGWLMRELGLPIGQFIVAVNSNAVLVPLFETTISNAIDIVVPYNVWRILYFTSAERKPETVKAWLAAFDDEKQGCEFQLEAPALKRLKKGIQAVSVSDETTLKTMNGVWKEHGYLLDPHAAVAVAGADHLVPKERVVCLATAHPAKFPMPVREALQIPNPQPLPKEAGHWSIADRYPREHVHRLPSRQACTKWLREAMLRPQTQVQGSDSKIEVLEEATLRGMVTRADAFEAAKLAFAAMADKLPDTQILPPMSFDFPDVRGGTCCKGAALGGSSIFAVKVASGFYDNKKSFNIPNGSGLVMVFDATTGYPKGLLQDNAWLTDLRTAAAGALAASLLHTEGPVQRVAVLGSGVQAKMQIEAAREVLLGAWGAATLVTVWSPTEASRQAYKENMAGKGVQVVACESVRDAVKGASLVVCCTPSRKPLIEELDWLDEGALVVAVGSDGVGKQEVGSKVAGSMKIVTDVTSQCIRLGELQHVKNGAEAVHAELGEVLRGSKKGRESDKERILVDLTGVGIQDAALAEVVWAKHRSQN